MAVSHAIITAILFVTTTGNELKETSLRKNPMQQNLKRTLDYRIVGGSQAQLFEYPYYTQWLYGCGAALIHEDILLTAAHCNVIDSNEVIIGGYETGIAGSGSVANTIVTRVLHPNYSAENHSSDYLLLKLATPVSIKPVKLNRSNSVPATGDNLVVVGLGVLTEDGNTPDFLQAVTVQAVDQETCNAQYDGAIDETTMLCAGVDGGGKDSCQGDSGGPIVQMMNGEPLLVGVVSWGNGCAWASHSGIYSRVSGAIDWIEQQICTFSSNPPATCNPNPLPLPIQRPTRPVLGGQNRPRPPPVTPQPTPATGPPSSNPLPPPITPRPTPVTSAPTTSPQPENGQQQTSPTFNSSPTSVIIVLGEPNGSSDDHGLSPATSPTHTESIVSEPVSVLIWTSYEGYAPAGSPTEAKSPTVTSLLLEPVL